MEVNWKEIFGKNTFFNFILRPETLQNHIRSFLTNHLQLEIGQPDN